MYFLFQNYYQQKVILKKTANGLSYWPLRQKKETSEQQKYERLLVIIWNSELCSFRKGLVCSTQESSWLSYYHINQQDSQISAETCDNSLESIVATKYILPKYFTPNRKRKFYFSELGMKTRVFVERLSPISCNTMEERFNHQILLWIRNYSSKSSNNLVQAYNRLLQWIVWVFFNRAEAVMKFRQLWSPNHRSLY